MMGRVADARHGLRGRLALGFDGPRSGRRPCLSHCESVSQVTGSAQAQNLTGSSQAGNVRLEEMTPCIT